MRLRFGGGFECFFWQCIALITVADGGMADAPAKRERWRNGQVATGGSSLSTSLTNCSVVAAS